jgi:hypothetical protein
MEGGGGGRETGGLRVDCSWEGEMGLLFRYREYKRTISPLALIR